VLESRFQSFSDLRGPGDRDGRLTELRREFENRGIHGFIVPRADEHQNEYVPANAERLGWLTGFTGSAGIAVVLKDKAALFVDGRYTEQAKVQVNRSLFELRHAVNDPPVEWIERNLRPGDRLGYDPRLQTPDSVSRFGRACRKAQAELVGIDVNPIDTIWRDRPAPPLGVITQHKMRFAGESATAKIAGVQKALSGVDGLLVTDPHNLAWLFNVRGSDVSHTPLPLGFAYLRAEGRPVLFLDSRKLSDAVRDSLGELAEQLEPNALEPFVRQLGEDGAHVVFDAATAPAFLTQALEKAGGKADIGKDPIALMKAVKNKAELTGARTAHQRDGAAMARFLAWFDAEVARRELTEIDAVNALEAFRRSTGALKDISFPTIAAAGPNSALPHYRVTLASNSAIDRGIFLIDSGGQYEDGTTDITRTIAIGRPTRIMRDRFTRVLKGHIAIACALFPRETNGGQIDALARLPLWQVGLDFDHGTGHGVGSYLSVHEGPHRMSKKAETPLVPGMILSNEPGYYLAGEFGIRIENLVVVESRTIANSDKAMLGFETLTLAPIDLRLIDWRLMDPEEIKWLNGYHAHVRKMLSPLVDSSTRRWLATATRRSEISNGMH
jgi:Xaa-Pro aminopeptidase